MVLLRWVGFVLLVSGCSCEQERLPGDASTDVVSDGAADSAIDGNFDSTIDLSVDVGVDVMPDLSLDASPDGDAGSPLIVSCTGGDTFTQLALGAKHTCAIRNDGALFCWGSNQKGQLGRGSESDFEADPLQVGTNTDWIAIDAGVDTTCGIRNGGLLFCWGHNQYGRLGLGDTNDRSMPVAVGTEDGWSGLSVGSFNTCAERAGSLYCWGHGANGRLGLGDVMDREVPTLVSAELTGVSTSGGHSCAFTSDEFARAKCWGNNSDGQLGNGSTNAMLSAVDVQSEELWRKLSTGSFHSCGVTGNKLFCWGSGGVGQTGLGLMTDQLTPAQVGTDEDWATVSAGALDSCGIKTNGTVWCWGSNIRGSLGNGNNDRQLTPVPVSGGLTATAVDASGSTTACALSDTGEIYCWGGNDKGQLAYVGDGSLVPYEICING